MSQGPDDIVGPGGPWRPPLPPAPGGGPWNVPPGASGPRWGVPTPPDDGSVVPLRPYGVREIYRGIRRLLVRAPGPVVVAALLGAVVVAAFSVGVGPFLTYDGTVQHVDVGKTVLVSLQVLAPLLVVPVLVPLTLVAVAAGAGRLSLAEALRRSGRALGGYLVLILLLVPTQVLSIAGRGQIGIAVITVPLGLVATWLRIGLVMTPAVAAAEGASLAEAGRRSWRLVQGSWWRTYGIYLLLELPSLLCGAVYGGVLGVRAATAVENGTQLGPEPTRGVLVLLVVGALFSLPSLAIGTTLLYVDLRCRKEGLAWRLEAARRDPSLPAFGPGGTYAAPDASL